MDVTTKTDCLSMAQLSNLVLCSTLAYWAHSKVLKRVVMVPVFSVT
jgi:hypothetical protein